MVTSVFSATRGLVLQLPLEADEDDADGRPALFVEVTPSGLRLDCAPLDATDLSAALAARLAGDPDRPVVLYTSPDAEYRRMVEAYDRIRESPARELQLLSAADRRRYAELFGFDPWDDACAVR